MLNRETSSEAMTTTLAETPCESIRRWTDRRCFFVFVAIHKMTERTLAASPHHESETRLPRVSQIYAQAAKPDQHFGPPVAKAPPQS